MGIKKNKLGLKKNKLGLKPNKLGLDINSPKSILNDKFSQRAKGKAAAVYGQKSLGGSTKQSGTQKVRKQKLGVRGPGR